MKSRIAFLTFLAAIAIGSHAIPNESGLQARLQECEAERDQIRNSWLLEVRELHDTIGDWRDSRAELEKEMEIQKQAIEGQWKADVDNLKAIIEEWKQANALLQQKLTSQIENQ